MHSPTTDRGLVAYGLAFIAGFGGMAGALTWMSIVEALNKHRPSDDQIPVYVVTWRHFLTAHEIYTRHGLFSRWKLLKDFRQQFPESNLYYWCLGSLAWMFAFFVSAIITLCWK